MRSCDLSSIHRVLCCDMLSCDYLLSTAASICAMPKYFQPGRLRPLLATMADNKLAVYGHNIQREAFVHESFPYNKFKAYMPADTTESEELWLVEGECWYSMNELRW